LLENIQFSGDGKVALQHGQAPRAASHGSTQPAWYEWEHGSVVVTSASVGTSSRQTAQSTVGNDAAASDDSAAAALAVSTPARASPAAGAFFLDTTAADEPGPGWLPASAGDGAC
jgi:hypothetical protein